MKSIVTILMIVLGAAAIGYGVCVLAGIDPRPRAMLIGIIVTVVSAILGVMPAILLQRSDQLAVSQASLGGSVLHMVLVLAMGGAAYALKMADLKPLALWTAGLYWASLVALAIALSGRIRNARTVATKSAG